MTLFPEFRLKRAARSATAAWQQLPIEPRRATLLGFSFRPSHAAALGLEPRATLRALLAYPFQLVRLGAYWNRIEPAPGVFDVGELDWQLAAAAHAGQRVILCVGPLKTFSYPEFFVPAHCLPRPFPEHTRIKSDDYPSLLSASTAFITRLVERYRHHAAIVAWQLEHEAVDPLGVEHSWRLDAAFVARELAALRQADSSRPVMLNGFLPSSLLVSLSQWWQTRDQGDSLAVAQRMADIVGVDYYPRHALFSAGALTLYLDGSHSPWARRRLKQLFARARTIGQQLMVAEGQAEPWETATLPSSLPGQHLYSCQPEHIIAAYNDCLRWSHPDSLYAYLFWGAEYWLLRNQHGDPAYLQACARILDRA